MDKIVAAILSYSKGGFLVAKNASAVTMFSENIAHFGQKGHSGHNGISLLMDAVSGRRRNPVISSASSQFRASFDFSLIKLWRSFAQSLMVFEE